MDGITLVSSTTFDRSHYISIRKRHSTIYGVLTDACHRLTRQSLPQASTAIPKDSGLLCFRALLSGLLLVVPKDAAVCIVSQVLPHTLYHYQQDDTPHIVEGPQIALIRSLVQSTELEESVSVIRDHVYAALDKKLFDLFSSHTLNHEEVRSCASIDEVQIQGLLVWVLSPAHSRQFEQYFTRSSRVWSLAVVLAELGFEVKPSTQLHRPGSSAEADSMEVILSTQPTGPTDLESHRWYGARPQSPLIPPRIVPLQAVPALLIEELTTMRHLPVEDFVSLEEAFFTTFERVRVFFAGLSWMKKAANLPESLEPSDERYDHISSRRFSFSDHALPDARPIEMIDWKPIGESLDQFATSEPMAEVIVYASQLAITSLFLNQTKNGDNLLQKMQIVYHHPMLLVDSSYTTSKKEYLKTNTVRECSILMRWIIFCISCRLMSDDDAVFKGSEIWPHDPKLLREKRSQYTWNTFHVWSHLLGVLLLGLPFDNQIHEQSFKPGYIRQRNLGFQAHGFALVPNFLFDFSTELSSLLTYQLSRGQLLNIPSSNGLLLDALESDMRNTSLRPWNQSSPDCPQDFDTQRLDLPPRTIDWLRCEVDPHWDGNPQFICLAIRVQGLLRASLRISDILKAIHSPSTKKVACKRRDCNHRWPASSLDKERSQEFKDFALGHALLTGSPILDLNRLIYDQPTHHWILDARSSYLLALIALSIESQLFYILSNCIVAALGKAEEMFKAEGRRSIIIICDKRNLGDDIATDID
ncbi:MAG: hypothetical protein M1814_005155 [Vezdaea aestivalis]|nr:MAG: hypothetical protein M1814_005155 [Vezdaea aestivalis]